MKKQIFCLIILITQCVFIFAQNLKFYYDYDSGYEGKARAFYVGTTQTINPSQSAKRLESVPNLIVTKYCEKLSKEETFLLWSALKEYDYKDNEVYLVNIYTGSYFGVLSLVAVIENNMKGLRWYGGVYLCER